MTPKQESIRNMVINAIVGALATLFLLFGTGAWRSKESVDDHRADVASIDSTIAAFRADVRIALQTQNGKLDRLLDAYCDKSKEQTRRVCAPEQGVTQAGVTKP